MNPTGIGLAVFAFTFGGARLIATMTALVVGLVTASAKSSFDAVEAGIRQYAIDLLARSTASSSLWIGDRGDP
jgi:hypothetical protein